jgi:hypothetical protein
VDHTFGNPPARNPQGLDTLCGLWTSDRLTSSDPGDVALYGPRRNAASHIRRNHPVAVYPVHHCLMGFGSKVGQIDIIEVAVSNRVVIGDHPVVYNRRRPEIIDDCGPVDIGNPEAGVTVHAVETAPWNHNRVAGVGQPADADAKVCRICTDQ